MINRTDPFRSFPLYSAVPLSLLFSLFILGAQEASTPATSHWKVLVVVGSCEAIDSSSQRKLVVW